MPFAGLPRQNGKRITCRKKNINTYIYIYILILFGSFHLENIVHYSFQGLGPWLFHTRLKIHKKEKRVGLVEPDPTMSWFWEDGEGEEAGGTGGFRNEKNSNINFKICSEFKYEVSKRRFILYLEFYLLSKSLKILFDHHSINLYSNRKFPNHSSESFLFFLPFESNLNYCLLLFEKKYLT